VVLMSNSSSPHFIEVSIPTVFNRSLWWRSSISNELFSPFSSNVIFDTPGRIVFEALFCTLQGNPNLDFGDCGTIERSEFIVFGDLPSLSYFSLTPDPGRYSDLSSITLETFVPTVWLLLVFSPSLSNTHHRLRFLSM